MSKNKIILMLIAAVIIFILGNMTLDGIWHLQDIIEQANQNAAGY